MTKKAEEVKDGEVWVTDAPDEIWTAKPLTIKNTVILVRLLGGLLARAAVRLEQLVDETGNLTEDGLVGLLQILDSPSLHTLLCIITNASRKKVEETFTLRKAMKVIFEFWQLEQIGEILGEAGRLATSQEFKERNAG